MSRLGEFVASAWSYPRRRPRLVAAGLSLVLVVAGTAWGTRWYIKRELRLDNTPLNESHRAAFLAELQPVTLKNCELKRLGGVNDGGYLICDNLSKGMQSAYSYGVGSSDDFACDASKRYSVPVHQYDCFDAARPACPGGDFRFNNECLAPRSGTDRDGRVFDTLRKHIARNSDAEKRLLVKIDIEGAEWEALLATPDSVLDRVDQMPMELHAQNGITRRHVQALQRLKTKFHVVNLHFNNMACGPELKPLPSWAFQVLLVNKRIGEIDLTAAMPAPQSPLNAPDNPNNTDCQLPAPSP